MADYAQIQDVADHLALTGSAAAGSLAVALAAAHNAVHDYCGWRFDQTATTTYVFPVRDLYDLDLGGLPLAVPGGVTISEDRSDSGSYATSVPLSSVLLLPHNGRRGGEPWPTTTIRRVNGLWPTSNVGRATVQITGTFGWPAVPAAVKQATILAAAWVWASKASPTGQAYGEFGPIDMRRIPQAEALLGRYRRAGLICAIGIGAR